jgi:hypothetical protein
MPSSTARTVGPAVKTIDASVLFFGGIARTFDSRPLRTILAALAVLLFLGTLGLLATMPICHE